MANLRIALCQTEAFVGDFSGNAKRTVTAMEEATAAGCDIAVFPKLAVSGSSLGALAHDRRFIAANDRAVAQVAAATGHGVVFVGALDSGAPLSETSDAALVCTGGRLYGSHRRGQAASSAASAGRPSVSGRDASGMLFEIAGVRVGVVVGAELWDPVGPVARQVAAGARLVVALDAAPFRVGAWARRERMLATLAADNGCVIAYVNRVGGQDGTVFDGGSALFDTDGSIVAAAERFRPDVVLADLVGLAVDPAPESSAPDGPDPEQRGRDEESYDVVTLGGRSSADRLPIGKAALPEAMEPEAEVWNALVCGLRAYVHGSGFTDVVLGLSGGVDSATVAAIAVDSLGPDHVHGVAMPSRYSSDHSISDATELAANLNVELRTVPIEPAHRAFVAMLAESFAGLADDVTEENLQARIRGVILMALSNKFGWMVLASGNKSETAVGYSTLYGDSVGALSVIGDVFKTDVYALCRWRNRRDDRPVIPEAILTKAPSAELRPGQRDDQSLPAYEILDPILRDHVEGGDGVDELVAAGHPRDVVERVVALVARAEYKRRQSPLPIVVTSRAFGEERHVPLTNSFRG